MFRETWYSRFESLVVTCITITWAVVLNNVRNEEHVECKETVTPNDNKHFVNNQFTACKYVNPHIQAVQTFILCCVLIYFWFLLL